MFLFIDYINLNPEPMLQTIFKFDLLRVISDHEQWVALNLPTQPRIGNVLTITDDFW